MELNEPGDRPAARLAHRTIPEAELPVSLAELRVFLRACQLTIASWR